MSALDKMVVLSIIITISCSSIVFSTPTSVGFKAIRNKFILQGNNLNFGNNIESNTQLVRKRVKREEKSGMDRYVEMAAMSPEKILKLYLKLMNSVLTGHGIGCKSVQPFATIFRGKINHFTTDIND